MTSALFAFSHPVKLSLDVPFIEDKGVENNISSTINSKNSPINEDDIALLSTLHQAKKVLQHPSLALDNKSIVSARDNLKKLIDQIENTQTRSRSRALTAQIDWALQSLTCQKSLGLEEIGDQLAASGRHTQAIMLYMAADMNQLNQTNMQYVVKSSRSLLALGHTAQAEKALLLASNQNAKNNDGKFSLDLHAEIDHLLSVARSPIANLSPAHKNVNEQDLDLDFLLCELGKIQHDTSQLRVESQQSAIKANRDARDEQINKKLKSIETTNKAQADREASEKKMNFWGKISKFLGMAVAVLGIALAPFTGGLSLIATVYLIIDLGLEMGEYFSGTKMSIQSGIQFACEEIVKLIAHGAGSSENRQLIAEILSSLANILITAAVTIVSMGTGAPKLFKVLGEIKNISEKTLMKSSKLVFVAANVGAGGTSVYSGKCAVENAEAGAELNDSDVQKTEIEKKQTQLDKLFEQCNDDLKLMAKELQHDMELLAEILSGNIESRGKNINALFHRPHLAA